VWGGVFTHGAGGGAVSPPPPPPRLPSSRVAGVSRIRRSTGGCIGGALTCMARAVSLLFVDVGKQSKYPAIHDHPARLLLLDVSPGPVRPGLVRVSRA
jgi:hypothetical protein